MSISIFGEIDISERNLKKKKKKSSYLIILTRSNSIILSFIYEKDKIGQ